MLLLISLNQTKEYEYQHAYNEQRYVSKILAIENGWRIQGDNICYGARDDQPGKFSINHEGMLIGVKLVHRSGYVTCAKNTPSYKSLWGCGDHANIITLIANDRRQKLFNYNLGSLGGVNGKKSREIVYIDKTNPIYATKGMELQIWYSEDFSNSAESDNDGKHCVDVYVKLVDPEHQM